MMLARIRNGIARLKPGQVQALGTILGLILFVVLGTRRRVAFANLRLINPQWASKQVHRFTRKVFQHFGITLVETTQMDCLAPTELLRRIQVEGAGHATEALEQGRGLIVISAHIGNWESALQLFPLYFKQPVLGVAKSFRFGFGHRWVEQLRTRTGNQVVPKKNALVRLVQTLRQGGHHRPHDGYHPPETRCARSFHGTSDYRQSGSGHTGHAQQKCGAAHDLHP